MNLFLREMKAARKSLIIWCIGIFVMVAGGMAKYEGLSTSGQSLNEIISKMPKSLQALIGTGTLDMSTAMGYYGILFAYLVLMAAIHALMLGATIIAKEERDRTAEFLLVKPLSRTKIMTIKLLSAFVNMVIFNAVTLTFSVVMVKHFSKVGESINAIYFLMAGMFLLQLIFAAVGTAIAAAGRRPKQAASIGTAVLLIAYFLSIAIDINSKLEVLKYITPFKYVEAKRIIVDGALDPAYVAISAVLIFALLAVSYIFYSKRDVTV